MHKSFLMILFFYSNDTTEKVKISRNEHTNGKGLIKTMILWNERTRYTFKIISSEYETYQHNLLNIVLSVYCIFLIK